MDEMDDVDAPCRQLDLRPSTIGGPMMDDDLTADAAADLGPSKPPAGRGDATVGRLAHALGINRRTIYKLRARGAPDSLDERAWRDWCHREGIRCRAAVTVVDGFDDVPRGTTPPIPAAAPAAASPSTPMEAPTSWSQEKAREDALLKREQRTKVQIEIAEKQRLLVDRDQVAKALQVQAETILAELVDLPAQLVRRLVDVPAEHRPRVRRACEQAIEAARQRMVDSMRLRYREALATPTGGTHASP